MKKHFLLIVIIGFVIYPDVFSGDNDSVVVRTIPEVTVSRTRNALFRDDKSILVFDSATLVRNQNANLGELLQNNSPLTINHYGSTGSIITVSFRGTGSNHSLISWNGFPLNSICSGEMDLSLAPVDMADQIMVVSTATGAICGSGTFGGAIELNNYADWNNRVQIKFSTELGSFDKGRSPNPLNINPGDIDSKKISLKVKAGTSRIQSSTSFFNKDALNKYPFINLASINKDVYTQEHNKYYGMGLVQSLSYMIAPRQQVEAGIWWQDKDYELPIFSYKSATSTSTFNVQRDASFKSYLKWQWFKNQNGITVKSAWFNDFLHYLDATTNSRIGSKTWLNDVNYKTNLRKNIIIDLGMSYYLRMSENNNYRRDYSENWYIAYSDLRLAFDPWIINISLRKDIVENNNPAPQLSLGGSYRLNKHFIVKANISNKFRLPTFNEKYWPVGGNPFLKPETGWSIESGTESAFDFAGTRNKFGLTIYSTLVNNWIQWVQPLAAKNFKQVWARGIESSFEQNLPFGKNNFNYTIKYNFTPVTTTKSELKSSAIIDKQLMLVPKHSINASIAFSKKSFEAGYKLSYRSKRFNTNDESGIPMKTYSLSDIYIEKTIRYKLSSFRAEFRINNIFDEQYEIIAAYPMPGRAFYITINYLLNKTE